MSGAVTMTSLEAIPSAQHGDRHDLPPAGTAGVPRPQGRVEREQVEEAHEQLGALHDVGDGLGEQRMDGPDEGHREGRPPSPEAAAQERAAQRARHDAPQGQGGQDVDEDVEGVVARARRRPSSA